MRMSVNLSLTRQSIATRISPRRERSSSIWIPRDLGSSIVRECFSGPPAGGTVGECRTDLASDEVVLLLYLMVGAPVFLLRFTRYEERAQVCAVIFRK